MVGSHLCFIVRKLIKAYVVVVGSPGGALMCRTAS